MRHTIREADIRRKTQTKATSPTSSRAISSPSPEPGLAKPLIFPSIETKTLKTRGLRIPSTSRQIESPKQEFIPGIRDDGIDDDDDDDSVTEEEAQTYGREENFGTVASPRVFIDTKYGFRKDGEIIMIGFSAVVIDTRDYIIIKGTVFKGTEG